MTLSARTDLFEAGVATLHLHIACLFAVPSFSRFLVVSLSVLCLLSVRLAHGQPSLSSMTPRGLAPGRANEVTVRGANLAKSTRLWSPSAVAMEEIEVAEDGNSLTCKLTPDSACPVGIIGLIAANASGVSDPILLMVDDLESVADNGSNHSLADAQEVAAAAAVDGAFDGPKSDFYRVRLNIGQRIAVEVVAQRMASVLDPVLRLLDNQGNEIAIEDDSPGFGADCRLTFQADAEGEFLIEVRDNRYRSGGPYRLRIGDFPLFTSPYPLGGRLGATTRFQFTGHQTDETLSLIKRLPLNLAGERLAVAVKRSGGVSSSMTQIAVSDLPERTEVEPNDESDLALSVTVPCAVSGVFNAEKDEDRFELALTKDQRVDFVGESHRYGSPALVFMQLFDAQGQSVAQTSINDADDSQFSYTALGDGVYQLVVRDLIYRGDKSFAYRVTLRSGADYSVTLKHADKTAVKFPVSCSDRALALTVSVQRRGYSGPIRLAAQESIPGLQLYNDIIPAGTDEMRLYAILPAETTAGDFWPLRFAGIAEIDGREVRRTVTTEATLRATVPQLAYPYPWQDGLFTVAGTAAADPFFAMTCETAEHTVARGGQVEIPLTLDRKDAEFKANVQLFAEQLPGNCKAEVKADADAYTVTVTCPADTPENMASLRFVVIGEHNGRAQSFFQDIVLNIVAPESSTEGKDSAQDAE